MTRQQRFYEKHKEAERARRRAYGKAHKKEQAAYMRAYRKRNPLRFKHYERNRLAKRRIWSKTYWCGDRLKSRNLRRCYGLTLEQFEALHQKQKGKCVICNAPLPKRGKLGACVDHDHKTGRVRGLLCACCNGGIGMFRDQPALLTKASEYLSKI